MRAIPVLLAILPALVEPAVAQTALGQCFDRQNKPATEAFDVGTVDPKVLLRTDKPAVCRLIESKPGAWLQRNPSTARERAGSWDFSDYPAAPPGHTRTDPERAGELLRRHYAAQGAPDAKPQDSGRALVINGREWRIFRVEAGARALHIVAVRQSEHFGHLARLYLGRQEWSAPAALEADTILGPAAATSSSTRKKPRR